jgi:glutathione S-transferase
MKAQVIAAINGFEVEITPEFEMGKDNKSEEYLNKFPMGQVPSFEANNGFCLAESGAIALYSKLLY